MFPALAACYGPVWLSPPGKPLTQRPSFRTSPVCDGDLAPGDVAHIVRIADHRAAAGDTALAAVGDPQGLLQAMQGDVRQQGTDHRALAGPLLGRVPDAVLDIARLEPLCDQLPGRERPDGSEEVVL